MNYYHNIYEQTENNDKMSYNTHEGFCNKQVELLTQLIDDPKKLFSKQMSYIPKNPPSDLSQIKN